MEIIYDTRDRSLLRRRPLGFVTQSFLPHRRLLIRAVNSFPIVRKYQLESTCQKQKHSYLSLYLTKFHHTFTKIIRKLFSIQGVNYFLRAMKKIPGFFLTNAMPTIKYRKVTSTEKQSYLSLQLTKFYHSFTKMILKLFSI